MKHTFSSTLLPVFLISLLALITFLVQVALISTAVANDKLWNALKSKNHIVLIRHSLAPGYSDPDNFLISDCTTQRNLNNTGREQSRMIGDLFRSNGINGALVYSSQWCRCLETAQLFNLGLVNKLKFLNSFFKHLDQEENQTNSTLKWITKALLTSPTLLVTHQVNITALTGYIPSSGEIVFVKRGSGKKFSVIGTIKTLH